MTFFSAKWSCQRSYLQYHTHFKNIIGWFNFFGPKWSNSPQCVELYTSTWPSFIFEDTYAFLAVPDMQGEIGNEAGLLHNSCDSWKFFFIPIFTAVGVAWRNKLIWNSSVGYCIYQENRINKEDRQCLTQWVSNSKLFEFWEPTFQKSHYLFLVKKNWFVQNVDDHGWSAIGEKSNTIFMACILHKSRRYNCSTQR